MFINVANDDSIYFALVLSPAFHFKILHDFVPTFNEQAHIFVKRLDKNARRADVIDIVSPVTDCTLDVILGELTSFSLHNMIMMTSPKVHLLIILMIGLPSFLRNHHGSLCRRSKELHQ